MEEGFEPPLAQFGLAIPWLLAKATPPVMAEIVAQVLFDERR